MKATLSASLLVTLLTLPLLDADPIRQHPNNPHWFQWQDRTIALITSAEHYGAVLNLDFDYPSYLQTLKRDGLNYTRIFTGAYVEPAGAFNIQRNTLAPAPGRFLAPWARSDQPGYAHGGNRFDLDRFSPVYLERLKDFLQIANQLGVVVELTFFTSTYSDRQWAIHPLNPTNNIQRLAIPHWRKLHTTENGSAVMEVQEKLVRWLTRELNTFDNLLFEIQNEPWADNHEMGDFINPYLIDQHRWPNAVEIPTPTAVAWQRRVAEWIRDEEASLPKKHLLAQNVANFRLPLRSDDLVPSAEIINFHYAYPEVVDWNRGLNRVIGYDESGFAGRDDDTYRRQAWNFVMAGGGLFNSLDYSFTVGKEDGSDTENNAPGGGGPRLREQLGILAKFLHAQPLEGLSPNRDLVLHSPGVVTRVLADPGNVYLLYLQGRGPTTRLTLRLPAGMWGTDWIAVQTGRTLKEEGLRSDGEVITLTSPEFDSEIALRLKRR